MSYQPKPRQRKHKNKRPRDELRDYSYFSSPVKRARIDSFEIIEAMTLDDLQLERQNIQEQIKNINSDYVAKITLLEKRLRIVSSLLDPTIVSTKVSVISIGCNTEPTHK
jgi:hypothetical protein